MRFHSEFTKAEITAVKNIIKANPAKWRYDENVAANPPEIDDEKLWMAHMRCLLTTRQKSGKGSPINVFLGQKPFPLSLESCRTCVDLYDFAHQHLTQAKGILRNKIIPDALKHNLHKLENGEWDKVRQWRDRLLVQRNIPPDPSHRVLEEAAADYMDTFLQFGSKQSRNFWQMLGLTRYVFVLDSRVLGWLRNNLELKSGLLSAKLLSDHAYYQLVSDILFDLCAQADELPCMFDGAVFSSYEKS
jgi:hypothetical protein